nr:toll/interleukin-1 receptor domain-containing protein [uncultured Draconibacterium sp.]
MSEVKEEKSSKTIKPLVFISHDTRDAELAEAFSNLLKSVSAGVLKSFRTSDKKGTQGIEYGVEWYPEIIKNIQDASDVVCLLTQHSINRPWILFEAGMAKGKLDTSILGVALGIPLKSASTGPFAQFQNCGDDVNSLTKLVFQLVDRIPNSEPDEETIKFQVGKFKEKIKEILAKKTESLPAQVDDDGSKENSSAKLFEEIKVMFQDLPSRIENNIRIDYREQKRRFHPMMIDDLCHMTKNPTVGITMALILFRNTSMPWVYDLGIELMKTLKSRKTKADKEKAIFEFREMIEMSTHHPLMIDMHMGSKEEHMFFREMPRVLIKNIQRIYLD